MTNLGPVHFIHVVDDDAIMVCWHPALIAKFGDRLDALAARIVREVEELESTSIYFHRFGFEDAEILIAAFWDDALDLLAVDADLVAYQDAIGEADIPGIGGKRPLLIPVPASRARTIH